MTAGAAAASAAAVGLDGAGEFAGILGTVAVRELAERRAAMQRCTAGPEKNNGCKSQQGGQEVMRDRAFTVANTAEQRTKEYIHSVELLTNKKKTIDERPRAAQIRGMTRSLRAVLLHHLRLSAVNELLNDADSDADESGEFYSAISSHRYLRRSTVIRTAQWSPRCIFMMDPCEPDGTCE
ncbi:hypothetical protein GQ600_14763 [Phytophthora cactorum]|nr:hypothetical protein GQ600_14763 [Phytophthora cactorum]